MATSPADVQPQLSKLASRQVDTAFADALEVVSNKVYDLPGAAFQRSGERDSRLGATLYLGAAAAGPATADRVCFYEHVATERHRGTGVMYVLFRETKDAQLAQQQDPVKYPAWLMFHPVKDTERKIFVHAAKPDAVERIRAGRVATIADWLDPIEDDAVFDSIVWFLFRANIITEQMYGKAQA